MSRSDCVIFVDDDATFSGNARSLISGVVKKRNGLRFEAFDNAEDVHRFIESEAEIRVVLGILDLWMIDKESQISNRRAGEEIMVKLREKWCDCYVIFCTNHYDDFSRRSVDIENIAIIDKSETAWTDILDLVEETLEGLGYE